MTLQTLKTLKRTEILRLATMHGASNVRVFGSVSRNESGPESDIDILVDLAPGRNLFDLGGLQADLRDLLNTPVDLVESSCLHPYIRDRVMAEAVVL